MKCKSCQEEVSQKFAHALQTNICPYCGQDIMPIELQVALSELSEVMKNAEQFHVEIFDWLSSNYNLIGRDAAEYKALQEKAELASKQPSKAVMKTVDPSKVELDHNGLQVSGEAIQDQETTNQFMKRAQVKTLNKQEHFREIVNQIKKHGATSVDGSGGMMVEADAEEVAALEAELSSGPGTQSALMSNDFDSGEEVPAVVEAMARMAGAGPKGSDYSAKDVAKLQELQNKARRASGAMASGGSVGLIKR